MKFLYCANCNSEIEKSNAEYNRSTTKRFFCNRSCASSYNNSVNPKRNKIKFYYCADCSNEIERGRKYCPSCSPKSVDYSTISYYELTQQLSYQKNAIIRQLARKTYFQINEKICKICGYSKHVEVCHIKAIKSFSPSTPISVINDISNLIGLCPNCHWELDNHIIKM